MIIVRLMGGLGNQMFQYAFGRSLAERRNTRLKLDISHFKNDIPRREYDLSMFNLEEEFASKEEIFKLKQRFSSQIFDKVANKVLGYRTSFIVEPHFHFSARAFNAPDNVYLHGYWQTEKYFSDIGPIIRNEFTFREQMSTAAVALLDRIRSTNSICVNVRRGDFVTNPFHGSYGVPYYKKADAIIEQCTPEREYFVFSDEIEWCARNLNFSGPTTFVSHEFAGPKFQDYLRLMAGCKHFIIPNSSFAWWAIWFNSEPSRIVIAPKAWFSDPSIDTSDLTPPDWLLI